MTVQPKLLNLSVHIDEHLDGDLSLAKLAARMKLSPFHFHRKFRDYFGESLHQHIKRLRLERAAWELLQHSKPVKSIALSSGYRTVSAFSHAFSLFAGVPPTHYREMMWAGPHAQARKSVQRKLSEDFLAKLKPVRTTTLKERQIIFLRTTAAGRGAQNEAREASEHIREMTGPVAEWCAALIDIHGVTAPADFRLDLGVDAARLPPRVRAQFGVRTLPGGRFAMFDVTCRFVDLLDVGQAIDLLWLPSSGERPRAAAPYVTFKGDIGGEMEFRYYLPLV